MISNMKKTTFIILFIFILSLFIVYFQTSKTNISNKELNKLAINKLNLSYCLNIKNETSQMDCWKKTVILNISNNAIIKDNISICEDRNLPLDAQNECKDNFNLNKAKKFNNVSYCNILNHIGLKKECYKMFH